MLKPFTLITALAGTLLCATAAHATTPIPIKQDAQCAAFAHAAVPFADASTHIVSATWHGDGEQVTGPSGFGSAPQPTLPAHCEIFGIAQERDGLNGQHYAIRFHMRLPATWNQRFVFQGGGGTDGDIGTATGPLMGPGPVAAALGYAVVSQDSGHDNTLNNDPGHNGTAAFGFDPVARENYGHASLKIVADAAKAIIGAYYGHKPVYSYFVGCSKGGQEGMTFAQFYPDEFDGIIAAAPGFALPRAAVAEAWDVQTFGKLVTAPGASGFSLFDLPRAYSPADLKLVQTSILTACDKDDGAADGMVLDPVACTDDKVLPVLQQAVCSGAKSDSCLSQAQVDALVRVLHGPQDSRGRALYSAWFWPSGLAGDDWRMWKIGAADGHIPALNVILGGGALASIFTTPPTVLSPDPQSLITYQTAFDFDRDAGRIYATGDGFTSSAWGAIGSHSTDLSAFRARKGRMIVPQGDSDPVFSLKDTLAWYDAVNVRQNGHAADTVRVFPVPGMCHCGGGTATDIYDAFSALTTWVEHGKAPDMMVATAGPRTPWPGRTRPLCAYPAVARYKGGDLEKADSFTCKP